MLYGLKLKTHKFNKKTKEAINISLNILGDKNSFISNQLNLSFRRGCFLTRKFPNRNVLHPDEYAKKINH